MVLPLYCLRVALARLVFIRALIMASATPVSSEGGTSVSIRAARGVRGFQHDAESPHVADAVIEAACRMDRSLSAAVASRLSCRHPLCARCGDSQTIGGFVSQAGTGNPSG